MVKKILFIIWSYTYGGGAEALLTSIVNHLNPEKYDISIIEYEHANYKVESVNDNIHILPPIEAIPTPDNQKKGYQVYHTPEILIEKYIKGDYDLYVSFNYQIPTFLLPYGTKNIAWIHTDVYDLESEETKREWRLQDEAFDKVRKIVAITDRTLQSLYDLFPRHREKCIKLYNGVDIENIKLKSREKINLEIRKPSIIFLGRMDANKNPERLLDIFSIIHQKRPDVHLYYVGDGERRDLLISRIHEFELEENVHLLGYQQNPFPILKQADVLGMFSNAEGFNLCMLEALVLGVPIVATDVGTAKLLTNNGKCGQITETNEESARAIIKFINADKDQTRMECQKFVQRFELKAYIERIEELFDSVIDEK